MRFLFVFLVLLHLLGCRAMFIDTDYNNQNTTEEATVKNNTAGIKWLVPVRGPDDRHSAVTTAPDVLVPSAELEAKEDATTRQPLDTAQDALIGGTENASLSNVTAIRTPEVYSSMSAMPKYFYEILGVVIVVCACTYGLVAFLKLVKELEAQELLELHNHAQQLPEPPQAPTRFQDLIRRDEHRPCPLR